MENKLSALSPQPKARQGETMIAMVA